MRERHPTQYRGIRYRLLDESRPNGPRRYVVTYTDREGTVRTKTMPVGATLEDAKVLQSTLNVRKANGESLVPVKKTVAQLLDGYLAARQSDLKPHTYENYSWGAEVVKDEIGHREIRTLTPNDMAALIAALQERGFKTWTVKKVMTPLVGALKVAVREGWIQSNPADRLLPHERPKADQKTMRCLTPREIESLLWHGGSDRWKALFATLTFTGLRIGEALALTWDDIDHANKVVRVRESKTEAGVREVMMIDRLSKILARWSLMQPPGAVYVFANANGQPVSRREALRALRAAETKAGLPNYTLHELRHTFASILISQGENVALVADQMGHADPSITLKTYAKLFDAQKNVDRARERLQAAMGGMV